MPSSVLSFKCDRKNTVICGDCNRKGLFAHCSLWSHLYCRDVKGFESYSGRASLGPICSFWRLRRGHLNNNVPGKCRLSSAELRGQGGNALWEPHNSPGMHGMRYLKCQPTCRLQSSLISINTEARNVNVYFPEREVGKKKVVLTTKVGVGNHFLSRVWRLVVFVPGNTTPASFALWKRLRGSLQTLTCLAPRKTHRQQCSKRQINLRAVNGLHSLCLSKHS